MPGFLETTLHQGYGYLDPYVEKARNHVPLIEQAAKKAEEFVPPLITRADELAEPRIEKMRPYVEPRIEQVKEVVAPYVDESVKYYNAGLEKVEQIKEFKETKATQIKDFKNAKTTQIKDFKEEKVTLIKDFTETRVTQIKDFKEEKVNQIKEFAEPKVNQIKEFAEPKVSQIKEFAEPKVQRVAAVITSRREQAQKLLRVPGSEDLKALDLTTLLGKVALGFEKAEALVDMYFPLTEEQKLNFKDSDASSTADSSCVRINRSISSIRYRLLLSGAVKVHMLLTLPVIMKTACSDGAAKEKICKGMDDAKAALLSKVTYVKSQGQKVLLAVRDKLATLRTESPKAVLLALKNEVKVTVGARAARIATKVSELTQSDLFKKALQMVVASSEKVLGKEKTEVLRTKVEERIPTMLKADSTLRRRKQ